MRTVSNILIGLGVVCYIIAIISKLTSVGLYELGIKPTSGLVIGNSCLLLALVINTLKK